MKKILIFAILLISVCCGCSANPLFPEKVKMDQLAMVQLLGVDSADGDKIKVTVLERDIEDVEMGQSAQGGSSESTANSAKDSPGHISAEAETLAKAQTQLQIKTQKDLFFGHMDYLIIGDLAATEGIYEYTSYIIRESVIPLNSLMYIAKGEAGKLMERADKMPYFLPDYLNIFMNNKDISFQTSEKTIMDFFADSNSDQGISVVPLIEVTDEKNPQPVLNGYAVLKDYKKISYLEGDEAKGYNILHNQYNNENLQIRDSEGENAALTVDYMSAQIIPEIKKGVLQKVYIHCKVKSNVAEDQGKDDFNKDEVVAHAENEQKKIIEGYIKSVLEASQESGCDVIELFKSVRIMDSNYYNSVRKNWEEIYKNVEFDISVNSKIQRGNSSRNGKEE